MLRVLCIMLFIPLFSEGETYYKLYVQDDGLYKVSGTELQNAGIDIGQLNPANIQLFSDGQRMLPWSTTESTPQLNEVAIRIVDGGDGQFNENDYLLFYGEAQGRFVWNDGENDFVWISNPYDKRSCYWLLPDGQTGKRIETIDATPVSGTLRETYTDYLHLEEDHFNPMKSGYDWSWNLFRGPTDLFELNFDLPILSPLLCSLRFRSKRFELYYYPTNTSERVNLYINGQFIGLFALGEFTYQNILTLGSNNTFRMEYIGSDSLPRSGLDYLEIHYPRETALSQDVKRLYFEPSTGNNQIRYRGAAVGDILILDVTDPYSTVELISASSTLFEEFATGEERVYWLNREGVYRAISSIEPASRGWVLSNSAEYIAVVSEAMEAQVQPLLMHRQSHNGFATLSITMEDIYNEFGFGRKDPTALRNAIKWISENWTPGPRFILLAGSGYYDYRNISGEYPDNWIPTFQISGDNDFVSREVDDYYTDLSFNGNLNFIEAEIAIGRLPADTPAELAVLVQKTIDAEVHFEPGLWRLNSLYIADDEFTPRGPGEYFWVRQMEDNIRERVPEEFREFKLYENEYPFKGGEKPDATRQLINWINQGNRIISYIGNAADSQWTHENLLNINRDISSIVNENRTSFLLGYTKMYLYDQRPDGIVSDMLKFPNGGIWGTLVSTRVQFSFASEYVQNRFWQRLPFDYVGEAALHAKRGATWDQTYRLLADPAMKVYLPQENIQITSITPDTLKGRSLATITGVINSSDPTGMLWLEVREPGEVIQYSDFSYESTGRAIYRGKVSITNATFLAQFVVPEDVNTGEFRTGAKIHAYSWNGSEEGMGYADSIVIGGLVQGSGDQTAPQLNLAIEQDSVASATYLVANLSDDSGINLSELGNRQPVLFLDGNMQDSLFVGEFFSYDEGSYTTGQLRYPLPSLADGSHTATLVIHDNYNNGAADSLGFTITGLEPGQQIPTRIELGNNYPNPFNPETTIPFSLSGGNSFAVKLEVYNLLGQRVKTLINRIMQPGKHKARWDGRNNAGETVASGVYYYRLQAGSEVRSDKMILLR